MAERKPKRPTARETVGEGVPRGDKRRRAAGSEDVAEPDRSQESEDARLIDRRRNARTPEGL